VLPVVEAVGYDCTDVVADCLGELVAGSAERVAGAVFPAAGPERFVL
jgi:hypothetical protein